MAQMSTVIAAAHPMQRLPTSVGTIDGSSFKLLIYVHAANGVPRGFYDYCTQSHSLLARKTDHNCTIGDAYLQDDFCSAPLHIFIGCHLHSADSYSDPEFYRVRLFHAGILAHRAAIASGSVGLGGTIVAGIRPRSLSFMASLSHLESYALAFVAGIPDYNARPDSSD
jgi:hypothetical protein